METIGLNRSTIKFLYIYNFLKEKFWLKCFNQYNISVSNILKSKKRIWRNW